MLPGISVRASRCGVGAAILAELPRRRDAIGALLMPAADAIHPAGCPSLRSRRCDYEDGLQRYGYRDITFCVTTEWLTQYVSDWYHVGDSVDSSYGLVSSVNDTLDAVWASYRSAMRADWSTLHGLLGCYNLPQNIGQTYLFFRDGWGAPHKFYLNTLQLIYTYSQYLEVSTGSGNCRGFRTFVEQLLEGNSPARANRNDDEETSCWLRVNYVNEGFGYENHPLHAWCWTPGRSDGTCDYRVGNGSRAWNDWGAEWVDDAWCWNLDPDRDDGGCGTAPTASNHGGEGGRWNVNLHPVALASEAWVADHIMFQARMARDFGLYLLYECLDSRGLDYLDKARYLGRYALRLFANHAGLIIHELGHVYLGSGHCEHDCCFDVAADNWACKVRGRLGLPMNAHSPWNAGDYDESTRFVRDDHDGCGSSGTGYTVWSCDIAEVGVDGSRARFCSTGCLRDLDLVPLGLHGTYDLNGHLVDVDEQCPNPYPEKAPFEEYEAPYAPR